MLLTCIPLLPSPSTSMFLIQIIAQVTGLRLR
nr:MAG TPA: hypothetical protein [Caudoviricetes sp.]